ncbi:hypothetical protein KXD40_004261 [Peronospora effusa]|nr:hypothetical protein KXD40_004261 [Peronospora effusa]
MGKKKRPNDSGAGGEALQRRIFCYYCDRNFDDEKVLILHQKARHFKCPTCYKKLSTISGMTIHMQQVHKESLKSIPNAKEGKESVAVEVYGMEGVPDADGEVTKKPRLDPPSGLIIGGYIGRGMPPPPFIGGRGPMQFPGGMTPPGVGLPMRPPPPRGFMPPPRHMQGYPQYAGGMPPQWARGPPPLGTMIPPTSSQAPLGYPNQGVPMSGLETVATPQGMTVSNTNLFDGAAQKAVKNDLGLVYADENESMEEKRALRPKYAYKLLGGRGAA